MKKVATILFVLLSSFSLVSLAQSAVADSSQQIINLLSSKISWHRSEPFLLLERGKLFMQVEKFDSAVADFSLCYQKDSVNVEVKKLLANAVCQQIVFSENSKGDTISSFVPSLLLDSSCICAKIRMWVYYLYTNKKDSSLNLLKQHLSDRFSKTKLVTDMLGIWYFSDSNYTEALHYLKSSTPEVKKMKALSNYYLGNYQQALLYFDSFEKDSIEEEELLFVRAKCYQKTGQLDKAMVGFEELRQKGYSQNHIVLETRITKMANFISQNWYYVLGLMVTLIALFITLWRFLKK